MRGLDIFTHAVRMVIGDPSMTLRIGGVLLVVFVVLFQLAGPEHFVVQTDYRGMMRASGFGFVLAVARIVLGLWVAVAWHRYILLNEEPGALAPRWNGAAIWEYFKAGVIFGLILIAAIIPMALIGAFLLFPLIGMGGQPGLLAGLVGVLVFYIPAAFIAYRLAPMLPSAAIGNRLAVGDAWSATRAGSTDFIVLALVSLFAGWLINMPGWYLAQVASPIALLWVALAQWLSVMVGASILTTIHGHYVENRPLNG